MTPFQIIRETNTWKIFYIGIIYPMWIFITSFFLFSCSAPSNVEKALDEQILHFGLGSEPQYLDPHLANSVSAHNVIIANRGPVSEDPNLSRSGSC